MLGLAVVCCAIWRNASCFDKKHLMNPNEIIFIVCLSMRCWAGLYTEDTHGLINAGVDSVTKTAIELRTKKQREQAVRMITDEGSR
jgi:hypothetical protein